MFSAKLTVANQKSLQISHFLKLALLCLGTSKKIYVKSYDKHLHLNPLTEQRMGLF